MFVAFFISAMAVIVWVVLPIYFGKKSDLTGAPLKVSEIHWPFLLIISFVVGWIGAVAFGLVSGEISGDGRHYSSTEYEEDPWENARR